MHRALHGLVRDLGFRARPIRLIWPILPIVRERQKKSGICRIIESMVEVAVKTAKILSASKRSQILQNGSLLQFNGKVLWKTVLRLTQRTAFRWIAIRPTKNEPCRTFEPCLGESCRTSANRSPLPSEPMPSIITNGSRAHNVGCKNSCEDFYKGNYNFSQWPHFLQTAICDSFSLLEK